MKNKGKFKEFEENCDFTVRMKRRNWACIKENLINTLFKQHNNKFLIFDKKKMHYDSLECSHTTSTLNV